MRYIMPSEPRGKIQLKGSKSHVQRILAAAMINRGKTVIHNVSPCDDVRVAVDVVRRSGRKVSEEIDKIIVEPGVFKPASLYKFGFSALSMRMFIPLIAAYGKKFVVSAKIGLMKRNEGWFEKELHRARIEYRRISSRKSEILPERYSDEIIMKGDMSSQIVTGLIMAGACTGRPKRIISEKNVSRQYLDLTMKTVKAFGGCAQRKNENEYHITGIIKDAEREIQACSDWSNGAYWLIWGVCRGDVTIKCTGDYDVDYDILNIIRSAGGNLKINGNNVRAMRSTLKPFECNCVHNPDIIPPLAVMASYINGKTIIKGTERLRIKESDRECNIVRNLRRAGVDIEVGNGVFYINGGDMPGGRIMASRGDHRLAMSYALAGLISEKGVLLTGDGAVKKSYDAFFKDMKRLKGDRR